jgi:signal transduction histidine kinase
MRIFFDRFKTIRWKLTGAFLLVALLLGLTLVAVFLAAIIFFLNSSFLPRALADEAVSIARGVADEYADPNGSAEDLIDRLRPFFTPGSALPPPPDGNAQVNIQLGTRASDDTGDDVLIALLDPAGGVITTTMPLRYVAGTTLGAVEPEPAAALIGLASAGITDTVRLSAWSQPDHQPIAVAPVLGNDGAVLGVVYLRLVDFPAAGLFLSNLTPFLITFIVPWMFVSGGLGMVYSWLVGRGLARRLARLTEATVDLSDGSLSRRIEDASADEIGQLGRHFNAMADQLAEHVRSLRLLADRNAQLAEQAAQLAAVEERNRLARELHDSVSQELFSLSMLAAAARRTIDQRPEQAAAQLAEIEATARRALEETRGLIFALRPAALEGRGLAAALRDLAGALRARQGFLVDLHIEAERRLPLEHEQALFRICQEALANAARHSGARAASVDLRYGEELITLTIRDGGRGFNPTSQDGRGVGLHSMAERAAALGGQLAIESAPGGGTTVRATIPVAEMVTR